MYIDIYISGEAEDRVGSARGASKLSASDLARQAELVKELKALGTIATRSRYMYVCIDAYMMCVYTHIYTYMYICIII